MPTQFNPAEGGDWSARPAGPKRSVFPNYEPDLLGEAGPAESSNGGAEAVGATALPPQDGAVAALARSFVYRTLAAAFADPDAETWRWLAAPETGAAWRAAWAALGDPSAALPVFAADTFEEFRAAYEGMFGHAARGPCPINELEYGEPGADPLYQPQRLADLVGFYRAFGMDLAEQADERPDHLSVELEFLCVLTAKEAWAWHQGGRGEGVTICRQAQKKFLAEHLGRWGPAFARRLRASSGQPVLHRLADCLAAFLSAECRRLAVDPGPVHLGLRPVDDAWERLCASCGVGMNLPGAAGAKPD